MLVRAVVFPVMRSHYATTWKLFNHVLSLEKAEGKGKKKASRILDSSHRKAWISCLSYATIFTIIFHCGKEDTRESDGRCKREAHKKNRYVVAFQEAISIKYFPFIWHGIGGRGSLSEINKKCIIHEVTEEKLFLFFDSPPAQAIAFSQIKFTFLIHSCPNASL